MTTAQRLIRFASETKRKRKKCYNYAKLICYPVFIVYSVNGHIVIVDITNMIRILSLYAEIPVHPYFRDFSFFCLVYFYFHSNVTHFCAAMEQCIPTEIQMDQHTCGFFVKYFVLPMYLTMQRANNVHLN